MDPLEGHVIIEDGTRPWFFRMGFFIELATEAVFQEKAKKANRRIMETGKINMDDKYLFCILIMYKKFNPGCKKMITFLYKDPMNRAGYPT